MLEFWFDPHTSIAKKLLLLIGLAVVTGLLYWKQSLDLISILLFSGTGIIYLICRYCKLHFAQQNPTGLLYRLLTWIPIALILSLIFMQMQHGEIFILGAQGIGFMSIAMCVFSPQSLFHQNNQTNTES